MPARRLSAAQRPAGHLQTEWPLAGWWLKTLAHGQAVEDLASLPRRMCCAHARRPTARTRRSGRDRGSPRRRTRARPSGSTADSPSDIRARARRARGRGQRRAQSAPPGALQRGDVIDPAIAAEIECHRRRDVLAAETGDQDVKGGVVGATQKTRPRLEDAQVLGPVRWPEFDLRSG